jgi:hypothetical protein
MPVPPVMRTSPRARHTATASRELRRGGRGGARSLFRRRSTRSTSSKVSVARSRTRRSATAPRLASRSGSIPSIWGLYGCQAAFLSNRIGCGERGSDSPSVLTAAANGPAIYFVNDRSACQRVSGRGAEAAKRRHVRGSPVLNARTAARVIGDVGYLTRAASAAGRGSSPAKAIIRDWE